MTLDIEDHGATIRWGMLGLFDEQEFWDFLEDRFENMVSTGKIKPEDADWLKNTVSQDYEQ